MPCFWFWDGTAINMDLSLLFMLIPRLAESREMIASDVRFGAWTSAPRRSAFPRRRHHQVVRLVPRDAKTRKRLLSDPSRYPAVVAVDADGREISLRWACTSGRGVDFSIEPTAPPFVAVRVKCKSELAADVLWVCAALDPK